MRKYYKLTPDEFNTIRAAFIYLRDIADEDSPYWDNSGSIGLVGQASEIFYTVFKERNKKSWFERKINQYKDKRDGKRFVKTINNTINDYQEYVKFAEGVEEKEKGSTIDYINKNFLQNWKP